MTHTNHKLLFTTTFTSMNNYFYLDSTDKQQGPVTLEKFNECGITRSTMVWKSGMTEWKRAGEVEELKDYFDNTQRQTTPPEPPHSNNNERAQYDNRKDYYNYNHNEKATYTHCPETNMVGAVIATAVSFFLGCSILGILAGFVAIYNADNVKTNYRRGLFDEAEIASYKARKWMKISLILWVITRLFLLSIYIFGFALSLLNPF